MCKLIKPYSCIILYNPFIDGTSFLDGRRSGDVLTLKTLVFHLDTAKSSGKTSTWNFCYSLR